MRFSYSWLQSFFEKKLPSPEKLAELLTEGIFETEVLSKEVLEVDVLPNRAAECLSYQGLAREIGAILGRKAKELDYGGKRRGKKPGENWEIEVKSKGDCPRYSLRFIEGIKIQPSLPWIKKRLENSGLRPINNVVDLANYVMLETGQPLHVFDPDKLEGKKIIIRRAKEGERITSLEGKPYSLDKEILVVADTRQPVALAGIKGGKKAEITAATQRIIVEAANFSSASVRRTWKKLGLRTDASWRFENGLDLNLIKKAQDRFAYLISHFYEGKPATEIIDFYPCPVLSKKVNFSPQALEKLVGTKINQRQTSSILKRLGFKITQKGKNVWRVTVPSWRLDVFSQADLNEEILRIDGYDKIPARASVANLILPTPNWNRRWGKRVKTLLARLGFDEAYSYSFIGDEQRKLFGYSLEDLIEVDNPVSLRQRYLRPHLIPNLLKAAGENRRYYEEIKLFEIGKVFFRKSNKFLERTSLAGMFLAPDGEKGFLELKGVIEYLVGNLMISDIWWDDHQAASEDFSRQIWHPTRVAEIKVGDQKIGFLGEIHPLLEEEAKIPEAVIAFEINFSDLAKLASEEQEYRPISSQPIAKRDLSIIVPLAVSVERVIRKAHQAGGILVRDVDLVEIYQGTSVAQGKKSLTLRIYFQALDRTLQTAEIDSRQKQIILAWRKEGWRLRN